MYSKLDLFLLDGLKLCMDSFDWGEEDDAQAMFDDFVHGLHRAKGERFSSRLPMLTELSNVFSFTILEGRWKDLDEDEKQCRDDNLLGASP